MKQVYPIRLFRAVLLGVPLVFTTPVSAADPEVKTVAETEEAQQAADQAAESASGETPDMPDPAATDNPSAATEPEASATSRPASDPNPSEAAAGALEPAAAPSPAPEPQAERGDRPGQPERPTKPGVGRGRPEASAKPDRPENADRGRAQAPVQDRAGRPERADREERASRQRQERPEIEAEPATPAELSIQQSGAKNRENERAPSAEVLKRRAAAENHALKPEKSFADGENDADERPATRPGRSTPTPDATPAEPAPVEREMSKGEAPEAEVAEAEVSAKQPTEPAQSMSEPEQQAENQVREATREVERELDQRKARLQSPQEARSLIEDIIGAESRISRAEIAREERMRPRMQEMRQIREAEVLQPRQREEAVTYFQRRLRGEDIQEPPPEFFRRGPGQHRDFGPERRRGRDTRVIETYEERVEYDRPRYLHEGRRYVHFDSAASVPAILMAAQAMDQVQFHRAPDVGPMLYERRNVSAPNAMPLPPEAYRDEESLVVSYPVDEESMITSDGILFQQGSTQFADPYSYEIVASLGDAMKKIPDDARFVIEGHASAEGSYETNMELSQQRAERIVREMVRQGVSPYRLLPVGYGESEARHPENAAESVRSQDRRVVVFRLKEDPVASR